VRPDDLSGDVVGVSGVVEHCIEWLTENDVAPEYTCLVFCNAFIQAEDIMRGWEKISVNQCANCFTTTDYDHPIQRALKFDSNHRMGMFQPEHQSARTQDCEKAVYDAGQFYWSDVEKYRAWTSNPTPPKGLKGLWGDAVSIVIARELNVDIDFPQDWEVPY